jgi:nucleotide-binding universal stress UspA family protein
MTELVVGVDGSPNSIAALRWALREGELHGWKIGTVLAWGAPDHRRTSEQAAREALEAVLAEAGPGATDPSVTRAVVDSLAADALIDASEHAALLVVGARGVSGFKRLRLGSTTDACLHHASSSVAVIPGDFAGAPGGEERIVVAVDGSEHARRALAWSLAEARVRGAALEAIHVWQMPPVGEYPSMASAFDPKTFRSAGQHILDRALEGVDEHGLVRPIERILSEGSPSGMILDAAKGADLVVVGSRGLGGFVGLLLGSVSHQLAHHAACPVVVVR